MATPGRHPRGSIMGLHPGQVISGRLEVGGLIGYGGQGVVLKVKHLEWGRFLALKLPLPEVVQTQVNRERYLQEAETWIRMGAHPHIVRCWFVHQVNGLPGLFLDLITGGSLEDQMKEGLIGPGHWAEILFTLLQVSEGLTHSHAMGVVHRDIKPENLLITDTGKVVLTDFGLVKPIDSVEPEATGTDIFAPKSAGVTGFGQFVGTPRYGAPEQWNKAMRVGPATDIYALGVLFYELLCGRRPFDAPGENPDPLELIQRHLHTPPPDPRTFQADVPERLAQLAMRCLAKQSTERPQSAEEMIGLLNELMEIYDHPGFDRPSPVLGGDRADLLNNAAVSLYSLGKGEKTRELLQRGLALEAGHPQCLYNLVQLDRREGKINAGESLRRLRRAKATYQLALLCIEEGLGEQARALLKAVPEKEKTGLIHRIEGDALMYAREYQQAYEAYRLARGELPFDRPTKLRLELAEKATTYHEGSTLFPSSLSCYKNRVPDPELQLFLSHDSQRLVTLTSSQILSMHFDATTTPDNAPRGSGCGRVLRAWIDKLRLVAQEEHHFEVWDLSQLRLHQRSEGKVLAVTRDLGRQVVLKRNGLFLIDQVKMEVNQIQFAPGIELNHYVKACFTPDERGLCLLTPKGQVAQIDAQYRAVPLAWPPAVPGFEKIRCFQLSTSGILYLTTTEGKFQAVDFANKKLKFSLKLPFVPESLQIGAWEKTIVLSSPVEFGLVKTTGKVILRGHGPCAIDFTRQYAVAWREGYLNLYNLSPFRRVRTWAEKIPQPKAISIAQDGRKAVSVGPEGEQHVWEVDEKSRVYERDLLLTPGESYEQLMSSYRDFSTLFAQAQRLADKNQYFLAYRTLQNARSESGFLQNEDALELQWELCQALKRGGLEAIWERLYSDDIVATALSADCKTLLLAQRESWSLREFGKSGGATRLRKAASAPILNARYLSSDDSESVVILIHRNGSLSCLKASDGEPMHTQDLGLGPLKKALDCGDSLFFISERFTLAFFDLKTLSITSSMALDHIGIVGAFPLQNERALIMLPDQGPAVLDVKTGKLMAGLPVSLPQLPGQVTFAAETPRHNLFLVGFSDGTILVANQKTGKPLFAFNHEKGPVTGICLNISMAVGVAVSSTGGMTLFDLTTGKVFEKFTAHSDAIDFVALTSNSRYLSTRTRRGESRFWELSWQLTDQTGKRVVEWVPRGALGAFGKMFKR